MAACLLVASCAQPAERPVGTIEYVGSSTVARFLRDAEPAYGAIDFRFDTEPESEGGERAIVEGRTALAGIARRPSRETLERGVFATLIGRDAIAVIVARDNPVTDISMEELRGIFTGQIRSWSELGGPDVPVMPFIVGPESATREVFRSVVLGEALYRECHEIRPDTALAGAVSSHPGGIGQLSLSLVEDRGAVRALRVAGEPPSMTNLDYPISRPLYLLWRAGDPVVEAFVRWTQSDEGQAVVMQRFVGRRVLGAASSRVAPKESGTLVVWTETEAVYDGGIYYYPHLAYEILTSEGKLVRRVPNRRGENDERPMQVELPPGTYLIRANSSRRPRPEFFVTIEDGLRTELDVAQILGRAR